MAIFLGILFAILAIGAIVFACYQISENDSTTLGVIGWVLAIAFIIAFIIVPFSLHTVDAGEVAVVKHYGEVKEVKSPGLHYDFWVGKSYEYINTKTEEIVIETMAYSSDAQVMTLAFSIHYNNLGDKAMEIVNTYGTTEALKSRIIAIATEAPKGVVSKRTAMEIIANREALTPEIQTAITNAIGEEYPVAISTVAITNIDFSDAFEQAVEEKMIAEQAKLKAEYENEKKVAAAEAEAKAKLLEAEAQAKANELLEKSITDKTLRDKYLDKWDGKLPSTMVGEDTMLMVPAA